MNTTTLAQALEMITTQDLTHWSDAHDAVTAKALRAALEAVQVEPAGDGGIAQFTEYFVKNYPGPNTIIHDPKWHAPKIFRAAQFAITNSTPQEAVPVWRLVVQTDHGLPGTIRSINLGTVQRTRGSR